MANQGIILGMGNPLLDLSSKVKPEMLAKYGLKENDAILYEKEDIFEELVKDYGSEVEYIAGGATQNTIRIAQWILGEKNATSYFGAIGDDESGKKLNEVANAAGVNAVYQVKKEFPTGRCAVLITGIHRSLVTKLDAANHFTVEHLDPNWEVVKKAKVIYSAGFFLTVCPDAMYKVGQFALQEGKTFALNLSAPFLPQFFGEQMSRIMAVSNLVFGNESEADAWAEKNAPELVGKRGEIAKKIASLPLEKEGLSRTVIITQGADPVIVVENGLLREFPIIVLSKEQIVDTNGAGDAFVGGYLAQLALGKDMDTRVKCGVWAATEIIQRSGCTTPEKMTFA